MQASLNESIETENFKMLLDSYSWIEFFLGSEKGKKVEQIIEENECFTSIVSIAEIIEWCYKNNKDCNYRINIIKQYSKILDLNEEIVLLAGKINFENKKKIANWGMLDSLIYASALLYDLIVLTGDRHFSGLKNAEML